MVSDVTRIGEFSPETFDAQWLDGAERAAGRGPLPRARSAERLGTGLLDELHGDRERARRREFAFAVGGPGGTTANTWRYRLEPVAGGTDVTESFELPATLPNRLYWSVAGHARLRTDLDGMRATLEKIKAVAERGSPG